MCLVKDNAGLYTISTPTSLDSLTGEILRLQAQKVRRGRLIESPEQVSEYLALKYSDLEYETFSVLFLNNRHRLIAREEMFRGTVDGASVWPREIVKRALAHNAAALILVHNHPSGACEPSEADKRITQRIQEACRFVDVRILDHIVVAGYETLSFAERGLL